MIYVPGEIATALFGSVENFYKVMTVFLIIGIIIAILVGRKKKKTENNDWESAPESAHDKRFEYMNGPIIEASKARRDKEERDKKEEERLKRYRATREGKHPTYEEWRASKKPNDGPKWYPTGWVYNEETGRWDPPDYLAEESHEKWRWDPEKGIWIDREKERRLEQYRKNREGKPPTYEEWRAAKLAEQAKQDKE